MKNIQKIYRNGRAKKISYFDKVSTSTCNLYSTAIMFTETKTEYRLSAKIAKNPKVHFAFPSF